LDDNHISTLLHKNDREGFEALFHTYYSLILKAAYYLTTDYAAAEDLTQELFLKIWKNRDQLQMIRNFKGYLLTAIKNSVLDYLEREKNNELKLKDLKLEWKSSQRPEFSQEINLHVLKSKIASIISTLPHQCRLVFSLNRFEGLSNQEIADYLGISKRTVETHISKALKILREEINKPSV
jgi:RNA polymerase sigma-19 factor, ECF subfamily